MNNRPKLSGRVLSWTGPSHWHAQGGQAALTSIDRQSARMGRGVTPLRGPPDGPSQGCPEPDSSSLREIFQKQEVIIMIVLKKRTSKKYLHIREMLS